MGVSVSILQSIPLLLILYQKRILSVHLIANSTIYENVHGEEHELTVSMIANTNLSDNVSTHRKTTGGIILIHE
jgi:hypothetical protein